ncbi:PREDICTED: uncharacterized protein LOC106745928 [Dinoponera quadriceps]|uniref:Uncharacterized protein LOC106745928 n=1 Tax=Dinoponera quadriceps TaxID=609295 RepID=A0A6P3XHI4_DINQU|nr:PREDICTED: uncharacterized protein LOC106745928 [Dinoponera quadriceps]XP_014477443.1 PREDICTED: uncharacterized protein LOC106745928 [Dinoponera quadriceps]XP_014477444.1 PREDICTED: uncharacterized protein LOC106745928 [Dinoponera quadriceps]
MSQVSGIMEEKDVLKGKPTLVRRVSDMFKDGSYSGPPMLFRNASMRRIRHCCQNLNLLPYLLYSFDNSKSHPIARKVHVHLSRFLRNIVVSLLITYENLRQEVLRGFLEQKRSEQLETIPGGQGVADCSAPKFDKFERQKSSKPRHSLLLIVAVYLVPLLLALQVMFLCNLTILGKYAPGFIFLIVALLFLGGIGLKILLHETALCNIGKCERKKLK